MQPSNLFSRIARGPVVAALVMSILALSARADADISIRDGAYAPAMVRIRVGDSVTWSNTDNRDHTVVADDGSFDSGTIKAGRSFTHRFAQPGTFTYRCTLHPRMRGRVVVE